MSGGCRAGCLGGRWFAGSRLLPLLWLPAGRLGPPLNNPARDRQPRARQTGLGGPFSSSDKFICMCFFFKSTHGHTTTHATGASYKRGDRDF